MKESVLNHLIKKLFVKIPRRLVWVSFLLFAVITAFVSPELVSAQYIPPKSSSTAVTATVPDITPPSAPILIKPDNGSLLNISTPTFIWSNSVDDVGVAYFTIYIDGQVWFDHLPTSSSENSSYKLTYDSVLDQFSLKPKAPIENGTFTWKVVAVDANGNESESVTWSFAIDTLAPSFIIDKIGSVPVGISVRDPSTFPNKPIELSSNEPLLIGTGERNSTVRVVITTPDQSESAEYDINNYGTWQLQLGNLPLDKVIYLDFVIEDLAGNISILNDVPFIILSKPHPPGPVSPTPSPTPSPSPGQSPSPSGKPPTSPRPGQSPSPPGSPSPTPPTSPSPPFWPPQLPEIKLESINIGSAFKGLASKFLPPSLIKRTDERLLKVPPKQQPIVERNPLLKFGFGGLLALLILAIPSLLSFIILANMYRSVATLNMLVNLAKLSGLIPSWSWFLGIEKYQSLVFQAETGGDVNFARVIFSGVTSDGERVYTQTITDIKGFFNPPALPSGEYLATVVHPCYNYPTNLDRPSYLAQRDFYRGEQFSVADGLFESEIIIPVDHVENIEEPHSLKILHYLKYGSGVTALMFALATVVSLYYPSLLNLISLTLFASAPILRFFQARFRSQGVILNREGELVEQAVLRFTDTNNNQTIYLTKSGKNDSFSIPKSIQTTLEAEENVIFPSREGNVVIATTTITSEEQLESKLSSEIKGLTGITFIKVGWRIVAHIAGSLLVVKTKSESQTE